MANPGLPFVNPPEGPFIVQDDYVFEFETGDNQKLNAEDPFVWYHRKDNCFYAVFKDFTGGFTKMRLSGLVTVPSGEGSSTLSGFTRVRGASKGCSLHENLPSSNSFMELKHSTPNF